MSDIIDSYAAANSDSLTSSIFSPGSQEGFGQCFTGNGEKIVSTQWLLNRLSTPAGSVVAKIWTMTGTFGVNGNVGSLLATSDAIDIATISFTGSMVTFTFSGANQYVTTNGTRYVSTFEVTGGDASNGLRLGYDASSPTHPGTWVFKNAGTWTAADSGIDLCFEVDGVAVNVSVDLTGVAASPTVGTGTVTIGSITITPPVEELVPSPLHRWLEDEEVLLQGVAANPQIGSGTVHTLPTVREMVRRYPFPQSEVEREPRRIPPLVVREPAKPPPPPQMVFVQLNGPRPMSGVGTGRVKIVAELSEYELMLLAAMDN